MTCKKTQAVDSEDSETNARTIRVPITRDKTLLDMYTKKLIFSRKVLVSVATSVRILVFIICMSYKVVIKLFGCPRLPNPALFGCPAF